ncbi:MAG: porin family protein [Gammaproteobacteria bacterium]|nr:porin family protein [Gammaproteobacteria bacterium]MDH3378495.1 porin family protein [Gammaproteobacteria bacterium]
MKSNWILKNLSMLVFLVLMVSLAKAEEFSGHISGFIGLKTMDSNDWPDLDNHFAMGIFFDITKDSWPVSIVLDITDTGGKHKHDGMEDLGHTTELHFGIRKIFINQDSRIEPYIGGGVSSIYAEQEIEVNNVSTEQDDSTVGIWLGAGMYYEMNPKFGLGLDVRYSDGEVTLFDEDLNAGGLYMGVTGGYQF